MKTHIIQWEHAGISKGSVDAEVIGVLMTSVELGYALESLRRIYSKGNENALWANRRALDNEAEEKVPLARFC